MDLIDSLTGIFTPFSVIFQYIADFLNIFIQLAVFTISIIPSIFYFSVFVLSHIFSFLIMIEIVILCLAITESRFKNTIQTFFGYNKSYIEIIFKIGHSLIQLSISLYQLIRG